MMQLNQDQKELIFDYCMGVCTKEQSGSAQILISSNTEASNLCQVIKAQLSPLDNWQIESCPDELTEKIVSSLRDSSSQSHIKLESLIANEQTRYQGSKNVFWVNFSKRLAMAAMFMIVGSILLGGMKYARHKALQTQCQAQLAGIWNGVISYSNDNNGNMPAVAMPTGTPWWMIGYQGQENYSNTRGVWLLTKGKYVNVDAFVCPGAKPKGLEKIDPRMLQQMNDFPNRRYINYSLKLICDRPVKISNLHRSIVMSDLNPIFENIPNDFSKPLHIPVTESLTRLNSANHNRKGQNVLFYDGSVRFVKSRRIEASNDDIFTVQGRNFYEGVETPTCENDSFLAP